LREYICYIEILELVPKIKNLMEVFLQFDLQGICWEMNMEDMFLYWKQNFEMLVLANKGKMSVGA
jgi:hypothetical protein